jgi:outer membrane protein TolC
MRRTGRNIVSLALLGAAWLSTAAMAQPVLTADQAVKMALERNSQIVIANAGVLSARAGLYGAYAGVLPRLSAELGRSGSRTDKASGSSQFGSVVTPSITQDRASYLTSPQLTASWPVFNLSSLAGLSSARAGLRASQLTRRATRADVALGTRQQFYQVVQAVKLIGVTTNALQLARDSERRVRALFEVGSVSRTDILQAQVQTAQSQLDSIAAEQALLAQRVQLATLIGVEEAKMGEVDTVLTFTSREYDERALLGEAERSRPDLQATAARVRSAKAALNSARLARLPFVSLSGSATYGPKGQFKSKSYGTFPVEDADGNIIGFVTDPVTGGRNKADRQLSGQVAISWDLFDGLATDSRIASARAALIQAQDAYDVLNRNLAGEVHEAVLTYQQALGIESVAQAAVASASESVKLTQQKYNVGSATILELITAQVALQRAQSQLVNALAGIRVAEARIDRVRGHGE